MIHQQRGSSRHQQPDGNLHLPADQSMERDRHPIRSQRHAHEPELQRRDRVGGSQSFGFQGARAASDAAPASFSLNGSACT
jgi:Cellulose binding domain